NGKLLQGLYNRFRVGLPGTHCPRAALCLPWTVLFNPFGVESLGFLLEQTCKYCRYSSRIADWLSKRQSPFRSAGEPADLVPRYRRSVFALGQWIDGGDLGRVAAGGSWWIQLLAGGG